MDGAVTCDPDAKPACTLARDLGSVFADKRADGLTNGLAPAVL